MIDTKSLLKQSLHKVERVDLTVARKVSLNAERPAGRWIRRFADLGDQPPLVAVSLAVVVAGFATRNKKLRVTGLRMLTAHSLSTIAKMAGKDSIDRTRPGALNQKAYRLEKGHSHDGRLRSMPSGHSAGIAALASAIVVDYPRALGPVAAGSVAIAAAQLPSRNHYLSDVVVGGAIGLVVGGIAQWLIPPFDQAKPAR